MQQQSDLFDPDPPPEDAAEEIVTAEDEETPTVPALAAPCGFVNCRNKPCRRLATKPLLMDGLPFVHRGVPLLLCDPACWRDLDPAAPPPEVDVNSQPDVDPEDPGPEQPPDYEDWSGWERADDDGFGTGDDGREEG